MQQQWWLQQFRYMQQMMQRLTQQQLADLCGENGVSRAFIQRVETGVSSCSLDTLIDIAAALKIPLYKLFEFKE